MRYIAELADGTVCVEYVAGQAEIAHELNAMCTAYLALPAHLRPVAVPWDLDSDRPAGPVHTGPHTNPDQLRYLEQLRAHLDLTGHHASDAGTRCLGKIEGRAGRISPPLSLDHGSGGCEPGINGGKAGQSTGRSGRFPAYDPQSRHRTTPQLRHRTTPQLRHRIAGALALKAKRPQSARA